MTRLDISPVFAGLEFSFPRPTTCEKRHTNASRAGKTFAESFWSCETIAISTKRRPLSNLRCTSEPRNKDWKWERCCSTRKVWRRRSRELLNKETNYENEYLREFRWQLCGGLPLLREASRSKGWHDDDTRTVTRPEPRRPRMEGRGVARPLCDWR